MVRTLSLSRNTMCFYLLCESAEPEADVTRCHFYESVARRACSMIVSMVNSVNVAISCAVFSSFCTKSPLLFVVPLSLARCRRLRLGLKTRLRRAHLIYASTLASATWTVHGSGRDGRV